MSCCHEYTTHSTSVDCDSLLLFPFPDFWAPRPFPLDALSSEAVVVSAILLDFRTFTRGGGGCGGNAQLSGTECYISTSIYVCMSLVLLAGNSRGNSCTNSSLKNNGRPPHSLTEASLPLRYSIKGSYPVESWRPPSKILNNGSYPVVSWRPPPL